MGSKQRPRDERPLLSCDDARSRQTAQVPGGRIGCFVGLWLALGASLLMIGWLVAMLR